MDQSILASDPHRRIGDLPNPQTEPAQPVVATRDAVPFVQVDAFTSAPFCGNPAAVCLLPRARDAGWMQSVAREMNLAETAFLVPQGDGFALRWFTPTIEVALCGHATLAAAHAIW